jgi:hypothetical protein
MLRPKYHCGTLITADRREVLVAETRGLVAQQNPDRAIFHRFGKPSALTEMAVFLDFLQVRYQ